MDDTTPDSTPLQSSSDSLTKVATFRVKERLLAYHRGQCGMHDATHVALFAIGAIVVVNFVVCMALLAAMHQLIAASSDQFRGGEL